MTGKMKCDNQQNQPSIPCMKFIFMSVFMLFCFANNAHAQLQIDVNRGTFQTIKIAISDFGTSSPNSLAEDIPQIITSNLTNSGLFEAINPKAFIQTPASIENDGVRFGEWRAINSQALVTGRVLSDNTGKTRVEFRLWDVYSQKQLIGMAYTTTPSKWRRIAHIISDEIYKRLTGESGYFDSRIVYISEEGNPKMRIKRLAIIDQDGANHKYLTDGRDLVLTPRFSPNSQTITYLSYKNSRPRVYLYNIDTGRQEILGDFPGMTFAPRFSPDGRSVIFSMSKNGSSDIYVMNLQSRRTTQLTNNSAIDTSPCFSPDGKQIVFESDRGGTQQLYVMDANGSNPKRITFNKGRYANPVWSPRGDAIAFTKMLDGDFYIGVIRPDGSGERLITKAYHVEGPSWSPNGRVLTYFKEFPVGRNSSTKVTKLYTIDLTGYNEKELKTPKYGSDPAWSPVN